MCSATANVLVTLARSRPFVNTGRCRPASMAALISGSCPHRLGRPSISSGGMSISSFPVFYPRAPLGPRLFRAGLPLEDADRLLHRQPLGLGQPPVDEPH